MKNHTSIKLTIFFAAFIAFLLVINTSNRCYAESHEKSKAEKKIEKTEMKIKKLKEEFSLTYTYKESFRLGAESYKDGVARRTSQRQLDNADRKIERIKEKIQKQEEKLERYRD